MALTMTQTEFDDMVLGIAGNQISLGIVTTAMHRQGDPDAWRREEELIMLTIIIDALKDYDVDADFLTNDNILHLRELATIIIENCPTS